MQIQKTLPPLDADKFLLHFQDMMGQYGLYQHATLRQPLLSEGYCTDDNARAVSMLVALEPLVKSSQKKLLERLVQRCWQFIIEAQKEPGMFLNFRTASGQWLPQDQSEDMYARVIRAAVAIIRHDLHSHRYEQAKQILDAVLPRTEKFIAPRAWAETIISLGELQLAKQSKYKEHPLIKKLTEKILSLWQKQASPNWQWFEPKMTYANAILPASLLAAHKVSGEQSLLEDAMHKSTAFLVDATIKNGIFIPIGSRGWYKKGGTPSTDNQQAIEAALMFEYLLEYFTSFPKKISLEQVIAPYLWFFGKNTGGVMLAKPEIGSCLDGLFHNGPNLNQGAESMLAYQMAEILSRKASVPVQQKITQYLKKSL